ncbi:MAG: type 4a pilus biogenesis protein PilO [Candidatus Omnitrophica bacterium]|nr:type 4a pilus biogenesis protein PilO [Candidatus Omnitrophota bacterium]
MKKENPLEQYRAYLENMDEKTRYYIFGGVLVVVFLLCYFIFIHPQLASLSKIAPEIKILKEDIITVQEDEKQLEQYKKQVADLKKDTARLSLRIRPKEEVSLVIETISRIANKYNVKIDQVMPDLSGQEKLLDSQGKKYYRMPIFIDGRSSYHDFGRFLNALEAGDIYIELRKFSISPSEIQRLQKISLGLNAVVFETGK